MSFEVLCVVLLGVMVATMFLADGIRAREMKIEITDKDLKAIGEILFELTIAGMIFALIFTGIKLYIK